MDIWLHHHLDGHNGLADIVCDSEECFNHIIGQTCDVCGYHQLTKSLRSCCCKPQLSHMHYRDNKVPTKGRSIEFDHSMVARLMSNYQCYIKPSTNTRVITTQMSVPANICQYSQHLLAVLPKQPTRLAWSARDQVLVLLVQPSPHQVHWQAESGKQDQSSSAPWLFAICPANELCRY